MLMPPRFYYPFPSRIHPGGERAENELIDWLKEQDLLTGPHWEQRIRSAGLGPYFARIYPDATEEGLLTVTLWACWVYTIDDGVCSRTTLGSAPDTVAAVHMWIRRILGDPWEYGPRPAREEIASRAPGAADFLNALQGATTDIARRIWALSTTAQYGRWCAEMMAYFFGTLWESTTCSADRTPGVEEYLTGRGLNCAGFPTHALVDVAAGYEISADEYYAPDLVRLNNVASRIHGITNDVFSYGIEHELDDEFSNFVAVLMRQRGLSAQQAVEEAVRINNGMVAEAVVLGERIMTNASPNVCSFVQGIHQAIRGNYDWHLITERHRVHDFYDLSQLLKVGEQSEPIRPGAH
ncbi:hypothetical protein [Streptomyces sp. NPDC004435]|uniref:terpene synthase family protein n=1 Tax=Streptomyces sp. NPDC004435 TaxID=3364701 RepID=UPI0036B96B01